MEEDLITQLPSLLLPLQLLQWLLPLQLSLSLYSLHMLTQLSHTSLCMVPIYRQDGGFSFSFQQLHMGVNGGCHLLQQRLLPLAPLARWWGIANKWQYLTITPFAIYLCNCPLDYLAPACILQLFQTYHSESICGQVYRYSPNLSNLTPRLTTPSQTNIPKCDSH